MDVIAVFDIGKTNKKFLLFNKSLKPIHQEEIVFEEITDDEGFPCDDIEMLERWVRECIVQYVLSEQWRIKAINFSTYGATLVHLDKSGKRLSPVYNYLKPMPDKITEAFYEKYGGMDEFSRKTASPALGMLNSGLQVLWLKRTRPALFSEIDSTLHFPQYFAYLFNGPKVSDYTSIGCHTALWDFDKHQYHPWIMDENIRLPDPVPNTFVFDAIIHNQTIKTGIGIHDSSASLVPYLMETREQFILISTGTWCIFMNPFNKEPLTAAQLKRDSLCYMSINQNQVKSSRLFLGHIHDVNVERLNSFFGVNRDYYKTIKADKDAIQCLCQKPQKVFFSKGIPSDDVDRLVDLSHFLTFDEAYHQLMVDLVSLCMEAIELVIPARDETREVYITGGFARNELFTYLLAACLPGKKVYISEIDNATALGAAMVVWEAAFNGQRPPVDLGLKKIEL